MGGEWAGPSLGYTEVLASPENVIDFVNIQFYNQGAGEYESYTSLFITDSGWLAESAVAEIISNGVAPEMVVVGKPIGPTGFASNGYVTAQNLQQWACEFKSSHTEIGGFMNWM